MSIEQTTAAKEKLLKILHLLYRSPSGVLTRSEMTRGMINKKMHDPKEREAIIQDARTKKLLVVGRKIQLSKGGQNPIIYELTLKGHQLLAPYVGDEDLEEHEK